LNQDIKEVTLLIILLQTALTIVSPAYTMIEGIFAFLLIYMSLNYKPIITFNIIVLLFLIMQIIAILGIKHLNIFIAISVYLTAFYKNHNDNRN